MWLILRRQSVWSLLKDRARLLYKLFTEEVSALFWCFHKAYCKGFEMKCIVAKGTKVCLAHRYYLKGHWRKQIAKNGAISVSRPFPTNLPGITLIAKTCYTELSPSCLEGNLAFQEIFGSDPNVEIRYLSLAYTDTSRSTSRKFSTREHQFFQTFWNYIIHCTPLYNIFKLKSFFIEIEHVSLCENTRRYWHFCKGQHCESWHQMAVEGSTTVQTPSLRKFKTNQPWSQNRRCLTGRTFSIKTTCDVEQLVSHSSNLNHRRHFLQESENRTAHSSRQQFSRVQWHWPPSTTCP